MAIDTPWIIDTNELEQKLGDQSIRIVDMTNPSIYTQAHIPGAVFLDYSKVVKHAPPIMGLVPDADSFCQALSNLGITPDTYIIAYDDEGGGKAARLLWTLEIAGHKKMSLLNGGIQAWMGDDKPISKEISRYPRTEYQTTLSNNEGVADADYIIQHLNDQNVCILDARSKNEFDGLDVRATRGGHIPGAVNLDWMELKDTDNNLRLKPKSTLQNMLDALNLSPQKEVITHCHTHHRSALSYVVLKSLGYEKVRGYPASWTDWSRREDAPVEN